MSPLRRIRRRVVLGASLGLLAGALTVVPGGVAAAPPQNDLTFHYFDCVGVAGTPDTFDAVKSHGFAFDVVDSNAVWLILYLESVATGQITYLMPPKMIENQAEPTVTCLLDSPVRLELVWATGVFNPPR